MSEKEYTLEDLAFENLTPAELDELTKSKSDIVKEVYPDVIELPLSPVSHRNFLGKIMSEKKLEVTLTELFELVKGSTKPLEDEIELLKKQRDQAIDIAKLLYDPDKRSIWFSGPHNKVDHELDLSGMKANFPELTAHLISLDSE